MLNKREKQQINAISRNELYALLGHWPCASIDFEKRMVLI